MVAMAKCLLEEKCLFLMVVLMVAMVGKAGTLFLKLPIELQI